MGKDREAPQREDSLRENETGKIVFRPLPRKSFFLENPKGDRGKEALLQSRQNHQKKKRITELKLHGLRWYEKTSGYIICLDTIVIHWNGLKRYIFTAIDKYGKVA